MGAGGMAHKDAVKKLGEMWSALSADKKKPYEDKAAALKAKYEKNVEKYKTTKAEKAEFEANKKAEIKRMKAADKETSTTKKSSSKKKSGSKPRSRSRSKKVKRSKSRSKSKSKKRSRSKSKK